MTRWKVLALVVSWVGSIVLVIMITFAAIERNNQLWCDYLGGIDRAYTQNPPSTDTGASIALANRHMLERFECEGK